MKTVKRILAIALVISLLLSSAVTVTAADTAITEIAEGTGLLDLINAASVDPRPENATAPFISAPDSSVLLAKENELLLYTSNKKGLAAKDDFVTVFEKMNESTSYTGESEASAALDLFFVTAAALNASGNGTDDHVAYLGVKAFDDEDKAANAGRSGEQVLMVVLYNARHKRVVDTIEIGSVKDWASNVEQFAYKTFFSITAGDYDNDGIDEIACTDHNMGVQMLEIDTSGSAPSLLKAKRYDWTALVSEDVCEEMKKIISASAEIERRALISLATGNFDGTGAEELAVATSTNNPDDDDYFPEIPEACTTQLAILASPLSDAANIKTTVVHIAANRDDDEEELDHVIHRVIYAGQIACGDLDGDRKDEIAIAGYTGTIEVDEDGDFENDPYEIDESSIALCYAKLDGTRFGVSEITVDAMTPFIEEGFYDDQTLVPLAIDAAKLHGQYGKESVFVGGKVYQFSEGGATSLYTHAFFEEESSYLYSDAYVEHVTSGNFGGPDSQNGDKAMINEQFVFTVVKKDNGQNDYSYKVGFICASTNQETNTALFADNTTVMEEDGFLIDERAGGLTDTNYGTALVPVAVDIDDDGLLVKHTNTTYFYEDPSVEAILQAAPYFEELGGWNEFNSSTTYSVSVSRSLIDLWGFTHSIHVGGKGKVDFASDAGEIELKVGYALDMDFEHETAYTTTYTTTFEAGSYDTVVVQRTPYICYEYSYVDIEGNVLTGEDAGTVVFMEALQPVYYQLSVDEYNRFVDEYNALAEKHDKDGVTADGKPVKTVGDSYRLLKITDDILPSGATGNPEKYYSALYGGEYISQHTYALGHNGGYTSSEFSYEVEQTYTATYAHGMHFELEGVGMVTTVGAANLSVGAFAALSFQRFCGYGDATINATGTGGTVANIIPSNYSESEEQTLKMFGFNWRCALWKECLMTDAAGNPYRDADGNVMQIPIVGYVVTNVKKPVSAPSGVNAYLSGNGYQVAVDWEPSSASNTDKLLGYYVYRSCDNQDSVLVNSDILPATASSFVDTSVLLPGKIYTYYVVARYVNGGIEYTTMNPKSSSVVWGVPQLSEDTLESIENGDGMYAASVFGGGSLGIVIAILALGASAASIGMIMYSKKKESPDDPEDEE